MKCTRYSQALFDYDQAGNRIKRSSPPDLSPVLLVTPSSTHGNTAIKVIVDVVELNGVSTSGLITVRITKDESLVLTFNPSATSIGSTTVQNTKWSFDSSSDEDYYILTSTVVIDGYDESMVGLTGTFMPFNNSGLFTLSTTIAAGSGGETKINNNSISQKIDYFP